MDPLFSRREGRAKSKKSAIRVLRWFTSRRTIHELLVLGGASSSSFSISMEPLIKPGGCGSRGQMPAAIFPRPPAVRPLQDAPHLRRRVRFLEDEDVAHLPVAGSSMGEMEKPGSGRSVLSRNRVSQRGRRNRFHLPRCPPPTGSGGEPGKSESISSGKLLELRR